MANLPDTCVALKILSSKYQIYACGKIFRAPPSRPNFPVSGWTLSREPRHRICSIRDFDHSFKPQIGQGVAWRPFGADFVQWLHRARHWSVPWGRPDNSAGIYSRAALRGWAALKTSEVLETSEVFLAARRFLECENSFFAVHEFRPAGSAGVSSFRFRSIPIPISISGILHYYFRFALKVAAASRR